MGSSLLIDSEEEEDEWDTILAINPHLRKKKNSELELAVQTMNRKEQAVNTRPLPNKLIFFTQNSMLQFSHLHLFFSNIVPIMLKRFLIILNTKYTQIHSDTLKYTQIHSDTLCSRLNTKRKIRTNPPPKGAKRSKAK